MCASLEDMCEKPRSSYCPKNQQTGTRCGQQTGEDAKEGCSKKLFEQ